MEFADVAMAAADLAEQRRFYGEVLSLDIEDAAAGELAVRAGRTRIRFHQATAGTAPAYHFALRVPGNRFAEARAWLAERTELLTEDGEDEFDWAFWGARAVYARDPAGNVIELIAFEGLDTQATSEFSGASIVGLAELGLPVGDPRAAVERLGDEFGLGLWESDDVTPDGLTPLGRRGATFLVVPLGRRWHLGDECADHPLDITLTGVRKGQLDLPGHPYSIRGGP